MPNNWGQEVDSVRGERCIVCKTFQSFFQIDVVLDIISQCMHDINNAFPNRERVGASDEEYRPPTPPPSDCSDSGTYHRSTPVTTIRIAGPIPNKVHTQQLKKRNQSSSLTFASKNYPFIILFLCSSAK